MCLNSWPKTIPEYDSVLSEDSPTGMTPSQVILSSD